MNGSIDQQVPDDPAYAEQRPPGHPAEGNPGASAGEVLSGHTVRPDGVLGPRIPPDEADADASAADIEDDPAG
jgi:hypothetical protein